MQAANNPINSNDCVATCSSEKLLHFERFQDDDSFGDCQPTQVVYRIVTKPPSRKRVCFLKETHFIDDSLQFPGAHGGADGHEGTPASENMNRMVRSSRSCG